MKRMAGCLDSCLIKCFMIVCFCFSEVHHVGTILMFGHSDLCFSLPFSALDPAVGDKRAAPATEAPVAKQSRKAHRALWMKRLFAEEFFRLGGTLEGTHVCRLREAIDHCMNAYPTFWPGGLSYNTAKDWVIWYKRQQQIELELQQQEQQRSEDVQAREIGSRGPVKRKTDIGKLPGGWKRMKAPLAAMSCAGNLIYGQVLAGVPLTCAMMVTFLVSVFTTWTPVIQWKPSISFVRTFAGRLGLSFRRATGDQRHLPAPDVLAGITRLFLQRFYWLVDHHNIPPDLVLNADETAQCLFPSKKVGWGEQGSDSVKMVGIGEKRQFTMFPVISALGKLVGMIQVIWGGTTSACEPQGVDRHEDELLHSHTSSHWSSPTTVFDMVEMVYKSHVVPTMQRLHLNPAKQAWIMLWDVHSSHRDKDLLATLRLKFPTLIVLFVPPSCTPVLQVR
jgi:hypothetical protein